MVTAIIGFIMKLARRHSGAPYSCLGAIGGLTYLAAIIPFGIRG